MIKDFRILEYKDHFRVQGKFEVIRQKYFLLPFFKTEFIYKTLVKNGNELTIREFFNLENINFKTKEEAETWISDYKKYPIIHEPNN